MSERTIPEPSADEIHMSRTGVLARAEANGIKFHTDQEVKFVDEVAQQIAQLHAEVRWLRCMIHHVE